MKTIFNPLFYICLLSLLSVRGFGQETSVALTTTLDACDEAGIFEEKNGYVVVEGESAVTLGEGWQIKNSYTEAALGTGHLQYTGSNSLGSVPQKSITEYKIKINTTGIYQFKWRSRNGPGAEKFDEENDSWVNIEADEFYGEKQGVRYDFHAEGFIKVWIQDLNNWSWNCYGEAHDINHVKVNGANVFVKFNNPGVYTIKFAGRSHGHPIDRFALYQAGTFETVKNVNTPESATTCDGGPSEIIWAKEKTHKATSIEGNFKIDGNIDPDWEFVATGMGEFETSGKELPAPEDLSYQFQLVYDADYLYLLATIKDDQATAYKGDGTDYAQWDNVTLYFNPDKKHNELGDYGDDASFIRMNYGVTDHQFVGGGKWHATNKDGFAYASKAISGGYLLEAKIPWAGILPSTVTPTAETILGFDIQVNDRDTNNEIEHSISFSNNTKSNTADTDTRKFGLLFLNKQGYKYKNKTKWEVIYADSEDGAGSKEKAIDGDPKTFWHTEWKDGVKPPFPHELHIDFKDTLNVAEVHYLPRQDEWGPNGAIGDYEIYISNDNQNWGTAVAKGSFEWAADLSREKPATYQKLHMVTLDTVYSGRFIKLVALSEAQNNPDITHSAVAELDIIEAETPQEDRLTSIENTPSNIKVFPNPNTTGHIYVHLPFNSNHSISVIDLSGQEVYRLNGNNQKTVIPTKGLQKGLYTIRIKAANSVYHTKVIVQ